MDLPKINLMESRALPAFAVPNYPTNKASTYVVPDDKRSFRRAIPDLLEYYKAES